jgi:transposase
VIVEKTELAVALLCIWARARAEQAACPACGWSSGRVHSRYGRRLADAAIGGRRVLIRLAVRRFFCGNPDCPVTTFAEQVEGLTSRYARRTPPRAAPAPPKVRDVASWLLRHPDSLDEDEELKLKQVKERCPHLEALAGHVGEFAEMLTGRPGGRLDAWIAAADASDLPDLRSFATGIKRDHDAVRNGLTLPWSSGAVEGNVNRLKMIKRQMYGRAGFALLRKRVLLC